MPDPFPRHVRSKIMSRIRSKNTSPEQTLRKELWKRGLRYRVHYEIPGRPDIVFPKQKVAIFVDGCFWHMCPSCFSMPKSNLDYWEPKLKRNIMRDKRINAMLEKQGWKVIRIWEHEIKQGTKEIVNLIVQELGEKSNSLKEE